MREDNWAIRSPSRSMSDGVAVLGGMARSRSTTTDAVVVLSLGALCPLVDVRSTPAAVQTTSSAAPGANRGATRSRHNAVVAPPRGPACASCALRGLAWGNRLAAL